MARILLIKPPWNALQRIKYEEIHLGLCYIASILRKANDECLVFDGDFGYGDRTYDLKVAVADYDHYLQSLRFDNPIWNKTRLILDQFRPDIVGISATTGSYGSAMKVAKIVKEHDSEIPVVMGGPHPTLLPEDTVKEPYFDIVVRGEGEYTMLEVVECLEKEKSLHEVKGITFKDKGEIYHNPSRPLIENLDSLPFPARDLIYEKEKYPHQAFGYILTSRGCPYECIFCSSPKIWGRKVRFRSPEKVVAEIEEVVRDFKTRTFRINDDTFTVNKKRVLEICDLLIEKNLGITWQCDTRVNLLTRDLCKRMKEAGCVQFNLGVESGNPEVLSFTKKGITLDQARNAIKMTKDAGILALAYFMIGFPDETCEQIQDTIAFMEEVKPDFSVFSIVTPYPGTELFDIARNMELLPRHLDWSTFFHHSSDMAFTKKISRERILALIKEIDEIVEKQYAKVALSHPRQLLHWSRKRYQRNPLLILYDLRLVGSLVYDKVVSKDSRRYIKRTSRAK